jgi:hypothetical protein
VLEVDLKAIFLAFGNGKVLAIHFHDVTLNFQIWSQESGFVPAENLTRNTRALYRSLMGAA